MSHIPLVVHPTPDVLGREGARFIAAHARACVHAAGRFTLAVSGGATPEPMFAALAEEDVPWQSVHVFQVDERVAPDDHPDRNFGMLDRALLAKVPVRPNAVHPMPVAGDIAAGAQQYAAALRAACGDPAVLDLVHLGIGDDGHTASLVPGDPVLHVADADVAVTGEYQGRVRMTLTYPALNRAARVLWLVSGSSKVEPLRRLLAGDPRIPAGRVNAARAIVFADAAAAASG